MKKSVILCVDDERTVLNRLKVELKEALGNDYLIEIAETAEEALEVIEEILGNNYELPVVVADYIMPSMKGDELLQRIHQKVPKTLKIMLTGQATIEAVSNVVNHAKLYRYISKPWDPEDLKLTVTEAIRSYSQEKKLEEQNWMLQQMNQEQATLITKLHDSENRLTQFLEAMPVGVLIHDAQGKISYINQTTRDLLGIGEHFPSDSTLEQFAEVYQIYQAGTGHLYPTDYLPMVRALHGEQVVVADVEVHQPSRIIPLEVRVTPVFDGCGAISYAILACEDITERKQAEAAKIHLAEERQAKNMALQMNQEIEAKNQELSLALQQLQTTQQQLIEFEKMAALGNLVAGVAHEINTPIGIGVTAVSHLQTRTGKFLELYQSNQMKRVDLEKFLNLLRETTALVLSNLERAAELVKSFKQVAVDQSTEEKRVFNMKECLQGTLLTLKSKLKRTQHQVEIDCAEGLRLNSYPGDFSQIVTHLVINSLTHGFEENEEGILRFKIVSENYQLTFEYSDNGKGISSEIVNRVFEPFVTTKRGQGGSGLGLNIVYNIVTQHLGGTIRVAREINRGTKFVIKVPCDV